jgi:hypothetical protein
LVNYPRSGNEKPTETIHIKVFDTLISRSVNFHKPATNGYSCGDLDISWKNDAQYIYMALNGSTKGWIAIGFEPTDWMKDADIVMGAVEDGKAIVKDEYSTGNYGPHLDDTDLGGTYDILEYGGGEVGGNTVIEFKRKMNTGDRFDKAFVAGQKVPIIWAMVDTIMQDAKHNVAKGEGSLEPQ